MRRDLFGFGSGSTLARRFALCGAALAATLPAAPARADSYDWWLFDQIELSMNPASAAAKRAEEEKTAMRLRSKADAKKAQPALRAQSGSQREEKAKAEAEQEAAQPVSSGRKPDAGKAGEPVK
jgi:hypothetical protein